jgi:hypothetical protein
MEWSTFNYVDKFGIVSGRKIISCGVTKVRTDEVKVAGPTRLLHDGVADIFVQPLWVVRFEVAVYAGNPEMNSWDMASLWWAGFT